MKKKRKVGRPPKWDTAKQLIDLINKYFDLTDVEELTVTGLALAIGTNRETLCQYGKKEKFDDIIKEAKAIVENSYELSLRRNGKAGDIFGLKNFGWKDKTEHDLTSSDKSMSPTGINWIEDEGGE
jgi:hypothetical protein